MPPGRTDGADPFNHLEIATADLGDFIERHRLVEVHHRRLPHGLEGFQIDL